MDILSTNQISDWLNSVANYIPRLLAAIGVFILFYLLAKILKAVSEKIIMRVNHKPSVIRLGSTVTYIVIIFIGVIGFLRVLSLDGLVTSVLAGAGIIGLALGFAFQDIASNFIAGVAITLQPRFNVGDLVEIDEIYGTVAQIDLRTTTIRTLNGQTVYVPNKDIFMNQVTDYTRKGIRRIELNVGVSYSDDLQQVKDLTLQAVYKVDTIEKEQPIDLYFEEFGDSSINLVVRYWVTFHTENDYLEARSQGIMLIKQTYDKHGITIPFPITTLDFMDNKTVKLTHKAKSK
ncbi:mechanosensitive ion channel [Candidatus Saccharibacteria bacterium]|nr:mechanosensitive ion channel [Candidatus Saccharibacteria bacterium]